ncbi:uncharacterized protein LOC128997441 [Macrosteles quadrilineatus]|uniref:uncharacterized protein LOC128997441 n=1 Tax=Macrosteles quadrilineatus TaxID=74068 RepID=UPI0023E221B6|nr:uncharacterized protein LOC128997441 [Macrosteles quadrilineatus]
MGLPVECLMGVIIQEMVEAEVAGVMFTRHPVSKDPSQLVITANYGLGETVVSGSVEPDTVIVNCENQSQLQVEMSIKGRKTSKLTVTEEGSCVEEIVEEDESDMLCLSGAEVIALAQLGVSLQQLFGWPRDVEWAINKGVIYLLQCRPVTSLLSWSEEELIHELDSAFLPGDATTTANTGEVLPGATSPLTQSTGLRCADFVMIRYFAGVQDRLWYNNNKIVVSHHHALLSMYTTLLRDAGEELSLTQRVLEMAVCGHQVSTPEMLKIAVERRTPLTLWQKIQTVIFIVKTLLCSKADAKKAEKIGEQFRLDFDNFTSADALFSYLTASHANPTKQNSQLGPQWPAPQTPSTPSYCQAPSHFYLTPPIINKVWFYN